MAGLPFWAVSLNMVSEPLRTRYSGEPEPYWLFAKTKAWLEILKGCGICNNRFGRNLVPNQKFILNVPKSCQLHLLSARIWKIFVGLCLLNGCRSVD